MWYDQHVKNGLKNIEEQMKVVLNMIEQGQDCREVITKISIVLSALEREISVIVVTNLEQCIKENVKQDGKTEDLVKEAINLLVKSR